MRTAGERKGERERWEEGVTKSLQQAQSTGCASEGGRQSRGALGPWLQLSLSRWLESGRGGWKLAQGL